MRRAICAVVAVAVLTPLHNAWADVAPSPEKGYRFIERRLVVDSTGVPDDIPRRYEAIPQGGRTYPIKLTEALQPGVIGVRVYAGNMRLGGEEWGTELDLDIPPQLEATHSADPRVRIERHYRLSLTQGAVPELVAEVLEDVLYGAAGDVLCRRPPLGEEALDFDPCDPTSAVRKRAHYAKLAAIIGAPLLLVAALFLAWRRRRSSRENLPAGA